jgi:hypothetical protein
MRWVADTDADCESFANGGIYRYKQCHGHDIKGGRLSDAMERRLERSARSRFVMATRDNGQAGD